MIQLSKRIAQNFEFMEPDCGQKSLQIDMMHGLLFLLSFS